MGKNLACGKEKRLIYAICALLDILVAVHDPTARCDHSHTTYNYYTHPPHPVPKLRSLQASDNALDLRWIGLGLGFLGLM